MDRVSLSSRRCVAGQTVEEVGLAVFPTRSRWMITTSTAPCDRCRGPRTLRSDTLAPTRYGDQRSRTGISRLRVQGFRSVSALRTAIALSAVEQVPGMQDVLGPFPKGRVHQDVAVDRRAGAFHPVVADDTETIRLQHGMMREIDLDTVDLLLLASIRRPPGMGRDMVRANRRVRQTAQAAERLDS